MKQRKHQIQNCKGVECWCGLYHRVVREEKKNHYPKHYRHNITMVEQK